MVTTYRKNEGALLLPHFMPRRDQENVRLSVRIKVVLLTYLFTSLILWMCEELVDQYHIHPGRSLKGSAALAEVSLLMGDHLS